MLHLNRKKLKYKQNVWPFVIYPSEEILSYAKEFWDRSGVGPNGFWYCEDSEFLVINIVVNDAAKKNHKNIIEDIKKIAIDYEIKRSGAVSNKLKRLLLEKGFDFCFKISEYYSIYELDYSSDH